MRFQFRPYRKGYILTASDGLKIATVFIVRPLLLLRLELRRIYRKELMDQLKRQ
jgi:hypothetical protein